MKRKLRPLTQPSSRSPPSLVPRTSPVSDPSSVISNSAVALARPCGAKTWRRHSPERSTSGGAEGRRASVDTGGGGGAPAPRPQAVTGTLRLPVRSSAPASHTSPSASPSAETSRKPAGRDRLTPGGREACTRTPLVPTGSSSLPRGRVLGLSQPPRRLGQAPSEMRSSSVFHPAPSRTSAWSAASPASPAGVTPSGSRSAIG